MLNMKALSTEYGR